MSRGLNAEQFIAAGSSDAERKELDRHEAVGLNPAVRDTAMAKTAIQQANRMKRPDELAERLLDLHESRLVRLPKKIRERCELSVKLAHNAKTLFAEKDAYEAALDQARRDGQKHLIAQAKTGKMPTEWEPAPAPEAPALTGTDLAAALDAIRQAKQQADKEVHEVADYETLYPLLMQAYDEKVLFSKKPDFDPTVVTKAEWDKYADQALTAAKKLREVNESFTREFDFDGKTKRTIHTHSVENGGLTHLGDYERYRQGILSADQIRVLPGEEDPAPGIETLADLQLVADEGEAEDAA